VRLNDILSRKVQDYNSVNKDRLIQSEEKLIMIEEPIVTAVRKPTKFKKLRRDAVSSSDEEEYKFDQMPSED